MTTSLALETSGSAAGPARSAPEKARRDGAELSFDGAILALMGGGAETPADGARAIVGRQNSLVLDAAVHRDAVRRGLVVGPSDAATTARHELRQAGDSEPIAKAGAGEEAGRGQSAGVGAGPKAARTEAGAGAETERVSAESGEPTHAAERMPARDRGAISGSEAMRAAAQVSAAPGSAARRVETAGETRPIAAGPVGGAVARASSGSGGTAHAPGAGGVSSRENRAAGPGAKPAAAPARSDGAFQAQLSRGLAALVKQRGGQVTMRLNPDALGSLRVEMAVKDGKVAVRFDASTAQARQLLESNLASLREALEMRGLAVEGMSVHGGDASDQEASGGAPDGNDPDGAGTWRGAPGETRVRGTALAIDGRAGDEAAPGGRIGETYDGPEDRLIVTADGVVRARRVNMLA